MSIFGDAFSPLGAIDSGVLADRDEIAVSSSS